jgi:hypothetical protein
LPQEKDVVSMTYELLEQNTPATTSRGFLNPREEDGMKKGETQDKRAAKILNNCMDFLAE